MSIHFGIAVCTYYRDDRTYDLLNRALESVAAQTHKDWTVYLIGDRFEQDDEHGWDDVKIIATRNLGVNVKRINLPFAAERDAGVTGRALWHSGGCFAHNFALRWMRCDGVDVHANLDHDDYWKPNHLGLLAEAHKDPEVAFAYSCGVHLSRGRLPQFPEANPSPQAGRVIHSSVSWRLDKIPFDYEAREDEPTDAMMWERITRHMKTCGMKWKCIPHVTVIHELEHK